MGFYDNERGIALPLTLFALLVLSIFGTTLWHASVAATIQTTRRQESMQAHYIARGGAEALAQHIRANPAEVIRLIANTSSANPARGTIGNGSFAAHVIRPSGTNRLQIISTGTVANVTSQVTLNMAEERVSLDVFRGAITQTSSSQLDLTNARVTGDVYSAGLITDRKSGSGRNFPDDLSISRLASASLPVLPLGVVPNPSGNNPITIQGGFHYTSITTGNRDLTFLTGGPDTTVQVVVDRLDVKGNIILNGRGRLELFITGNAVIRTGANGLINVKGNESNLIVYLQKGASIQFQANPAFHGYIYAPEATVSMQSGQTRVFGSIVANRLQRKGDNVQGAKRAITHVPPPLGRPILIHSFNYRITHWSN